MPESNDEATSEKIKLRDMQQNKWPEIFKVRERLKNYSTDIRVVMMSWQEADTNM